MIPPRESADYWIDRLALEPLPLEGGFYRETVRGTSTAPLGPNGARRALHTAIYYLLTPDTFSAFHRLCSDEVYHVYAGDAVELVLLDGEAARVARLGPDPDRGETFQELVPAGTWQGSRLVPGGRFALLGTTVSPGFTFEDFTLGERAALLAEYPLARDWIERLTRSV